MPKPPPSRQRPSAPARGRDWVGWNGSPAVGIIAIVRRPLPREARTSIWWQIIGLLQKSTSGLGQDSVSGRSRVPKPPTRMQARRPVSAFPLEVIAILNAGKEFRGGNVARGAPGANIGCSGTGCRRSAPELPALAPLGPPGPWEVKPASFYPVMSRRRPAAAASGAAPVRPRRLASDSRAHGTQTRVARQPSNTVQPRHVS